MTTPDAASFLRLELEGLDDVDFKVYAQTSVDLDAVLRRVSERRAAGDAHWRLVTDPVIHVTASPNGVSASALNAIVRDTYEGLAATVEDDPTAWPDTFDKTTRDLTRRMVNRLRSKAPVTVEASREERLQIPASGRYARLSRPVFSAWATVEGRLRSLADYPVPQFVLYEQGTDNPVRCGITADRYDEVYSNWLRVVRVHGFVFYRSNGKPSSVRDVSLIEPLSPPERALTEFEGLIPRLTTEMLMASAGVPGSC